MTVAPVVSLNQSQAMTALRGFLLGAVSTGTQVILAQVNRVPEPRVGDFVVMTPLRQVRLETNETTYGDNSVVGSIAGNLLTVTEVENGVLAVGQTLHGTGLDTLEADTTILEQLSGSIGSTGIYFLSGSQVVSSGVLYAGQRIDLVGIELTVQLDVHGPTSFVNVHGIDTLFRSEEGVTSLEALNAEVTPLYCGDARQVAFVNAEQQYEDRWVMEVVMEITPTVKTNQRFADEIEVELVVVDALPVA